MAALDDVCTFNPLGGCVSCVVFPSPLLSTGELRWHILDVASTDPNLRHLVGQRGTETGSAFFVNDKTDDCILHCDDSTAPEWLQPGFYTASFDSAWTEMRIVVDPEDESASTALHLDVASLVPSKQEVLHDVVLPPGIIASSPVEATASPTDSFVIKPPKPSLGESVRLAKLTVFYDESSASGSSSRHCVSGFKATYDVSTAATTRHPTASTHSLHRSAGAAYGAHKQEVELAANERITQITQDICSADVCLLAFDIQDRVTKEKRTVTRPEGLPSHSYSSRKRLPLTDEVVGVFGGFKGKDVCSFGVLTRGTRQHTSAIRGSMLLEVRGGGRARMQHNTNVFCAH